MHERAGCDDFLGDTRSMDLTRRIAFGRVENTLAGIALKH
jgi:hypothetical protein